MTVTLATLEQSTAQEVFDHIAKHLLTQKTQCIGGPDNGCSYRNEEGMSCAAGCIMTDYEYRSGLEGRAWYDLINEGFVPKAHKDLIQDLQTIHDLRIISSWPRELQTLAASHELIISEEIKGLITNF